MSRCLLCQQQLIHHYTLKELLLAPQFYLDQICGHCLRKFTRIDPTTACRQCCRPGQTRQLCQDCRNDQGKGLMPMTNRSLFHYNQAMHDYFQAYKRHGDYQMRQMFAGSLRQALSYYQTDYLITYIPTSDKHYQQRQFDPVVGLFADLCPLETLLKRNAIDWHQSTLKRSERLKAPQIFIAQAATLAKISKSKILLVDDIYTTGTTLRRAGAALRTAGFIGEIESLTLAR